MEAQNASFGNGQNDFNYRTATLCHVSVEGVMTNQPRFACTLYIYKKKNLLQNLIPFPGGFSSSYVPPSEFY